MLTDAMLKEATAEAERFLLTMIPDEGEPHVFSKRFERKMNKLIRRVDHPVCYQVMRMAAAVVLAIATLFGAVMAVSPEARAAVVGWVKSAFHEFFEYSSGETNTGDNTSETGNNQANGQTKHEYFLAVIPEGYRELKTAERPDGKTYLYIDDVGNILQFTYSYGAKIDSMFIKTEDYKQHSDFVHDLPADIYIAVNENETSVIVWQDLKTNALIQIFAIADKDELIEIAQNVKSMI